MTVRAEYKDGKWNGRTLREWVSEAVDEIVRHFNPVRVILFGSVARGEEGPDSDIDLLVVFDELPERTKLEAEVAVRRAITVPAAVEVLVTDLDELAERGDLPGILRVAQREGRVVHERAA
jgi:predicted nucleotidyltransferase